MHVVSAVISLCFGYRGVTKEGLDNFSLTMFGVGNTHHFEKQIILMCTGDGHFNSGTMENSFLKNQNPYWLRIRQV